MRRLLLICLSFVTWMPAFGQGILRLERVQPGATVVIETTDGWGEPAFDRCKLIRVDTGVLTCVDVLGTQGRELFPLRQIDAVYEVHKSHAKTVWAGIGVGALLALTIGGLASGNLGLVLLAGIFGGVWGAAATGQFPAPPRHSWPYGPVPAGTAQPWGKVETGRLVYVRRWRVPLSPP